MIDNDIMALQPDSVSNIIHRGGTILKSSRCPAFLTKEGRQLAYDNLRSHGIDALVAIGAMAPTPPCRSSIENLACHLSVCRAQ